MATARSGPDNPQTRPVQDRPRTVADLLRRLGNIPARRVRLDPSPGKATEQDLLAIHDREKRLLELVEGVLVEKPMGFDESEIALLLGSFLVSFVRRHKLGIVAGPDGPLRLFSGLVRLPDVSFISWNRLPARKRPTRPIPALAPDLAVEVLSKGNTKAEMSRKLGEYFKAGTRLVWIVDPRRRTVCVYVSPEDSALLEESQTLDGGAVLPGFRLPLRELFPAAEG
ncbi:MAG TPA: Uma2 family endonuclease [Isosphaeraceae bacterium]|jgi:Uma2 family endonuclease|nr:Uma2 family endonuclease [Isosphaeraceae bacterium]